MPEIFQHSNAYSADSPAFDPFIIPMPSADNPQPYNAFTAVPSVPFNPLSDTGPQEPLAVNAGAGVQPKPHVKKTTRAERHQGSSSPPKGSIELSCAPPSSSPSFRIPSKDVLANLTNFSSVRRKPVGSLNRKHPTGMLSKETPKKPTIVNHFPKQTSIGVQGPRTFLDKLKPNHKLNFGVDFLPKRTDRRALQRCNQRPEITLFRNIDPEALCMVGWLIIKVLSMLYLLWLAVRILFALRQVLDVALVPVRLVIMIVAWFFRR